MKTINDFKVNDYAYSRDIITADGRINSRGIYEINDSSILTRLIQEAGRYCERYASDLFIDWQAVQETIGGAARPFTEAFLFGFRAYGVDHAPFILAKANNESCYGPIRGEYRSLWRLDITADGEEIEMNLGRVFR